MGRSCRDRRGRDIADYRHDAADIVPNRRRKPLTPVGAHWGATGIAGKSCRAPVRSYREAVAAWADLRPEAADGGDALGAVAAALGDVLGGEAADGVDRQGGVFAQGFEGGPADAGGVGMGRRLADGAEDGEVAADCFGLAQLGFVVAGGGQGDI